MSARYIPHARMVESGIPWLGMIPAHWEIVQSRRLFAERKERMRTSDEQLTASQKYGVIPQAEFMRLEDQKVMQVFIGADILKHVEPDDFVISMRSFQGGLEWCGYVGCVSSAYVGITPIKHVVSAFFKYLFKSRPYIQALQSTSNLVRDGQALRFQNFAQVSLPVLPGAEQTQIAKFLDYETAKIDALIEKQQQLIALLKEKRQAVISHAVTKGLNPAAPLRDSGAEWLGEVPAHWAFARLSMFAEVVDPNPSHRNPEYVDDGFPFISTVEFVENGGVETETPRRVSEATVVEQETRCRFRHGSIAFSRKGTIGAVRLLPTHTRFALLDSVCVVNPLPGTVPEYLLYWLGAAPVTAQIDLGRRGAALPQLSVGAVRRLYALRPPVSEQQAIVQYLDRQCTRIDLLMQHVQEQLKLLHERRAALISAAVTGKIDVRNWTAPSSSLTLVVHSGHFTAPSSLV